MSASHLIVVLFSILLTTPFFIVLSTPPQQHLTCRLLCGITKASTTLSGGLRVTIPPLLTTESSTSRGGIVLELARRSSKKITQAQTCLEAATASQLVSFEKPAPDSTCGCRQARLCLRDVLGGAAGKFKDDAATGSGYRCTTCQITIYQCKHNSS